jgi:hypothetical protein
MEAIFRFTKCWIIETNVWTVWLDVEISSSAQYSGGYIHVCKSYKYTNCVQSQEAKTKIKDPKSKIKNQKSNRKIKIKIKIKNLI